MKLQISQQTKREMIIFLIVAISFMMLIVLIVNDYQNQKIQELKIEKQKLEERNEELFQEFKNETKRDSVSGARMNRPEREDDVSVVVEGEIREISWYSELDSCHYPKAGKCLVASGKIAKVGMVATWTYEIGTKLEIDGKIYTVEDRTNREYGHRIDIFCGYGDEAHQLAKANGIQYKQVKVLN